MSWIKYRPYKALKAVPASILAQTGILLALCTGLISCAPDPYFKKTSLTRTYSDTPASALNRHWVSSASRKALRQMRARGATSPASHNERIAVAEQSIREAKKSLPHSVASASTHYLTALEHLWPVIKDSPRPGIQQSTRPTSNSTLPKKRILLAHRLYGHAAGQIAQQVCQSQAATPHSPPPGNTIQLHRHSILVNTRSPHSLHPREFDAILPLDTHRYGNIGTKEHQTDGLGAAALGLQKQSPHRLKQNPYIPPSGLNSPINVIVDFPSPGQARLTLTDLLQTQHSKITGTRRVLSADYSASIAAIASTQSSLFGFKMALNPHKGTNQTGLHSIGLHDPTKIPLIFVHGLISQPSTWATTSNHLIGDPEIRANYQFFYFFYQTGQPPLISGAKLRRSLLDYYDRYQSVPGQQHHQTVLIGHSMGGLLSSIQSRTFSQKLHQQLFVKEPELYSKDSIYAKTKVLIDQPTLHQIRRTVFVATPHLGSNLADRWIGRIGSSLIKLPQSLASLELNVLSDNMTDFGRAIIGNSGTPNSINYLKAHNPSLVLLSQQPFNPRVTYHSIIGTRGARNVEKSSDGAVPYWSSHIEGAQSEKLVPAWHDAHMHPDAQQEINRILHLHLKTR